MNNMKFIFITIITAMLLSACGGAEERKAAYLEKARLSMEAGDLDKARIELKNVLQIDPKDARAYFQLGTVLEQKNDYLKAFGSYRKAVELDPDNFEYQAKVGRYYLLMMGEIDKAIEKRDLILGKDETNINGLLLKAGILLKQNDTASAKKIAQGILSKQPGHIESAVFLSTLYLGNKEYEAAINVLNACIKENSEDRYLKGILADTYSKAGKNDLAENEYKQILQKNPELFLNHLRLAMFYRKIEEIDKAEHVLRDAIKEDVEDVRRKLVFAEFVQQTRGNQDAIEELKSLVANNHDMGELRLGLARLYVVENNLDDAEKIFKSAISDFSEDSVGIEARVYLAGLYMQKKNADAAISIIDDAIKISPNDSEVNFVKAKLLMLSKDYEGAIISLRTVIKDDPENIMAYFLLSAAHKAIGEEEQADEIMNRAHENNRSNTQGLITLARYHARNKNKSELEKVVDNYLSIDPRNYEALSFKSALLNERKMFPEAKPYISQMIELYPDKPNGYIQSVPYLLAENRESEAVSLLEDGYKRVNKNARLLELLVSLHVALKNFDAATNKIQSAIHDNSNVAELYMLLAKVQLASNNKDDAKTSLIKARDIKPDWNDPYLILANIYIDNKQDQKAIDVLQQGLSVINDDPKLLLRLVGIYEKTGQYNAAIDIYERALQKHSNNIVLINNLAALLSEHRSDEASLSRAKELADKLKKADQPAILDTVGWVYYKTSDYTEAVTVLKTVVEKSPDVPVFNYHLGMALLKAGDEASAKTYLTRSLANNSNFRDRDEAEAQLKKLQ